MGIITKAECFLSLAATGLNFTDFAAYPKFFANSSSITLAQAGNFKGPHDIAEYVSFASEASAYFGSSSTLPGDAVSLHAVDEKADTCTFDIMRASFYTFSAPAFDGASAWVAYGLRLTLHRESAKFLDASVYYPVPTMLAFFSSFFDTVAMHAYVCSTLKTRCPAVWAANSWGVSTPLDACIAQLTALPVTDDALGYFNRNTMGCRILHAEFAQKDPIGHCPHVSFTPYRDRTGALVCQPSQPRTTPAELGFDASFLRKFDAFAASRGIDTSSGSNLQALL